MNEDRATRYHRLRRRAACGRAAATAVLLGGLIVSGGGVAIARAVEALVGGGAGWMSRVATVWISVALLWVLVEAVRFPFRLYGFLLDRRYGLCAEGATLGRWGRDVLKGGLLGLLLAEVGAVATYEAMARWPRGWWWMTAGFIVAASVALAYVAPVLVLPRFYQILPLRRRELAARLAALARRAGLPVADVWEWHVGSKTTRVNAALVGLGRTRRILLTDTLLQDFSDEEIEVIFAHELAHHVTGDLWRGLLVEAGVWLVACVAADRALGAGAVRFHLRGLADVAGLPLLVLSGGTVLALAQPMLNVLSRRRERAADRFALTLTGNATAFRSAMRRLGARNLAEPRPSRLVELLWATHPSLADRLALAEGPPS